MTIHVNDIVAAEASKYGDIWQFQEYRKYSPGRENAVRFMEMLDPPRSSSVIDLGCGEGVGGLALAEHGLEVSYLDIVNKQLDARVNRKRFIQSPLWGDWYLLNRRGWDYGYCCDVMEHMPSEFVMLVLDRICRACATTYFSIAFQEDSLGALVNQPLHLTVMPFAWWRDRLAMAGRLIDARDLCGAGVFILERD